MNDELSRRGFLGSGVQVAATATAVGGLLVTGVGRAAVAQTDEVPDITKLPPSSLVLDFIRASHSNLEMTRKLLDREPTLLRVAWHWGLGDYETGIAAAAHTGTRPIIKLFIERGAPYTLFAAATLGDLEVVQAIVKAHPDVIHSRGAHGIPLLDHAAAGGEEAGAVHAFLKEKGARGAEPPRDLPMTAKQRARYVGRFRLKAHGRTVAFRVYEEKDELFLDAGAMGVKRLQWQGQDRFQLLGTPATVNFEVENDRAVAALMSEGGPIGRAVRLD